ncbi:MAG: DUF547 domain-containing protein [Acidobacteria bacterium]|nr:DUF547 domain-containing protein [Acidobacteriota bacterium]MCI0718924.1 DUF547 domain-containing protein [Acidobacteriota bacterium]
MRSRPIIRIVIPLLAATVFGFHYWSRPIPTSFRPKNNISPQPFGFSLADYAAVLEEHVTGEGLVRYQQLKSNRETLDRFGAALGKLGQEEFEFWDEEEQVAFWINAYNALTLTAIINHYPIVPVLPESSSIPRKSIRQIPGVWDQLQFTVMGNAVTLDQIEHQILRKRFDEPRIHLALVCAAKGCPPLRNEPFDGHRLESQLQDLTRRFLSDPSKFRIDRERARVLLSSIFQWYGEDFVSTYGTGEEFPGHNKVERAVLNFVARHLDSESRDYLIKERYRIEYLDYDWSLNEESESPPLFSQTVSTQARLHSSASERTLE